MDCQKKLYGCSTVESGKTHENPETNRALAEKV
jgi:hypothetical protein